MIRNERLRLPEEDGYKKGGRIRLSLEITAKVKRKKGKKAKKKGRKATGKRARGGEAMKYVPLGGALPTTGMSSTVFGAPQAPSYFRAVLPQQEFANIPDVLKGLKAGQDTTLKKLQYFEDEGKRQIEFNREVREEFEEQMRRQRKIQPSKASVSVMPSPMTSRSATPIMSYSTSISVPPIQTLNPLEPQRTATPPIMTPVLSRQSSSIPTTAIRLSPSWSWSGAMSSREAGYMGADESLPIQAPASGENMRPEDASQDASQPSSFVPLGASQPESVDDSVERASAVASPAPVRMSRPRIITRPKPIMMARPPSPPPAPSPPPSPPPAPSPPRAPAVRPYYMRDPATIGSRDELNSIASGLGIRNAKQLFTGIGSTDRLRAAIKAAQAGR
jgi:hypothetical protein